MQTKLTHRIAAAAAAVTLCCCSGAVRADDMDGLSKEALTPTPQMQAVLDELQKQPGTPVNQLSAADARKQPNAATAAMAIMKEKGIDPNQNPMEYEKDFKIETAAGNLPIRVYNPGSPNGTPLPVIVYYHGGGFVIATNDTYESSARALAKGANAVVFAVEYRKAPEAKYPAAYDDAIAAYKWAIMHASDYNGDNKKVAVAGESAGGNLAAGVAQAAKDLKIQPPALQLLIYPWVDNDMENASYKANGMAKPLNKAMLKWFTENYISDGGTLKDPHVFPAKAADLSGLAPAMVITDSIDPLMSEGKAYAMMLKKAGVPVEYKNYEGVTHEFFGLGAVVDTAKQAEMDAAAALKKAFMADMTMTPKM